MRIDRMLVAVLLLVLVGLSGGVLVAQSQEEIDLDKGLVAYWSFDEGEGDIAFDATENHNDGTLKCAGEECSPSKWVEGKIGLALEFDGADDYIDCGKDESLDIGTGDFTFEAWAYTSTPAETGGWAGIVDKGHSYSTTDGAVLGVGTNNKVLFALNHMDPYSDDAFYSSLTLNLDQWYHLVGVKNGTVLKLYINGQHDTTHTITNGPYDITNSAPLVIGHNYVNLSGRFHNGTIDEVRIYNRALTEAEIKWLYEQEK